MTSQAEPYFFNAAFRFLSNSNCVTIPITSEICWATAP